MLELKMVEVALSTYILKINNRLVNSRDFCYSKILKHTTCETLKSATGG